ncbi:MAG: hypothetical protein ACI86M_001233 [Saprospiraceae bacterium]|jgi:hypothetical protein
MRSISDAAKPQPWEVDDNLIAITSENEELVWKEISGDNYLLVLSWKEDTTYYKNDVVSGSYNTENYPVWVTTAPELQNLCSDKKFGRKEGLNLRLKQLFGLPPTVTKKYFVEFWVKPEDLFRPCPDTEINDASCGLSFPKGTSDEYIQWVNNLRIQSYYNPEWNSNYPWTELGYTYDWNPSNKLHIGLSEFVIRENSNVIIHNFVSTADYCKAKK